MVLGVTVVLTSHVSRVGVDTAELQLGDNLKINLNLQRQTNEDRDITYLVRAVACVCIITVFPQQEE